uniref:Retrotransposon gag domain-containing protein n=1 Tax=Tanacetum cinerariifolium TaxID=118510 RepID=A0A6L2NYM5_TANCI|nr:hypothetical protein [Tanacetum cinerariifolium]
MAELDEIMLLLMQQSDAFQAQMAALQADLQATKGLIQAERYGGGGETAPPIPGSLRLDVPKFSGTDPDRRWAKWFRWMTSYNLITIWDGLSDSVRNRFGPCKYEDPQGALSNLLQKGTVAQYQGEFEKLVNHVTDVSDGLLISFYVSDLKPAIPMELLVSKPTSLGDAFALARVTEACLDDQRVSMVSQATTGVSRGVSKRIQSSRISAAVSQPAALSQSFKPSLLPTPTSCTSDATAKPLAIKWISPWERQERLAGACILIVIICGFVDINARHGGAKASLRREAWPPRYEMDQGVDSRRGVRRGMKRRAKA